MAKKGKDKSVDKEREEAFKSLPPSVRNALTEEEIELFLHSDEWPESLFEKLEEFITGDTDGN